MRLPGEYAEDLRLVPLGEVPGLMSPPGEYSVPSGLVGEYAGLVGEYAGEVGEYAGDVGE